MKGKNWKGSDGISRAFDWLIPPSGGMFSDMDIERALGKCPRTPRAAPVSKMARAMVLDDLIRTLDDTGEETDVGGMVVPDSRGGFKVFMNAQKFPEYSPEMKAKLLHELRHVWQHHQSKWKSKFRNETNPLTDVDVEVDAFERQFEMEKILGVEAKYLRNFFLVTDDDEFLSPTQKRWQKARRLYEDDSVGYKPTGRYYLKDEDDYEQEYGK